MTFFPLTTSSYGAAGGSCWIKPYDKVDIMWRYLCFYGPLWIAIIYMIIIYIKVFKRLTSIDDIEIDENDDESEEEFINQSEESQKMTANTSSFGGDSSVISIDHLSSEEMERRLQRKQNNTLQKMKFYPMILIFCYTFATIRRVIDWATEDQTPYWLAVLHTFFCCNSWIFKCNCLWIYKGC